MPQAAFNTRWIEGLKPDPHRQIEYFDSSTPNFGLRLSPKGTRAFFAWYRLNGRLRKYTLGKFDREHFGLAQARRELHKVLGRVAKDEDVAEERAERRRAETFAELATLYIERHAKPKKKSWAEDQRILNKDVLPVWKHRKIHDIRRRDIVALLDGVGQRGPVMAANTLALIRKVFNFAIQRDLLQASPCVKIPRPCRYVERDRALSDDELRTFLAKLATADMTEKTRVALELILRTGLRPGEVCGGRWDEVEGEWWTIPANRCKNGLAHRVPITTKVCELLNKVHRLSGDSEFIFDQAKRFPHDHGPLHPEGVAHAVKRNLSHFGLAPFTPHDLRRSAATALSSLGIRDDVIDAILNHAKAGVLRIYNRYSYDAEKREALELWQKHLDSLVAAKAGEQKLSDSDQQRLTRKLQDMKNRVSYTSAANTLANPLAPPLDTHSELLQLYQSAVFLITKQMHREERGRRKGQQASKHRRVFSEALREAHQKARSTRIKDIERWLQQYDSANPLTLPSGGAVYADGDKLIDAHDDMNSICLSTLLRNPSRYLK